MEQLASFVAGASALFYWAEHDENPAVQTYWDAYHYVATSLTVGYANLFPVTQVGKIIGAAVMMAGPSLAEGALDDAPQPRDAAMLERLDAILAELRKLGAAPPSGGSSP